MSTDAWNTATRAMVDHGRLRLAEAFGVTILASFAEQRLMWMTINTLVRRPYIESTRKRVPEFLDRWRAPGGASTAPARPSGSKPRATTRPRREIATRAAEQARAAVGSLSAMSARRPGEPAQRPEQHHVDTFQPIATAKLVGELLLELADFTDAIPLLETSVRLSAALLAEDDMRTDGQAHREASLQLYLLGAAHEAMGDLGLADRYLSDAL